jgi:hypothetical protein
MRRNRWGAIPIGVLTLIFAFSGLPVLACGGLFCQTSPVNQDMERIIFTMNDDGTISAYIQINYTGAAPKFSWVVPVAAVPEVDVAEMATFDELVELTDPRFFLPPLPDCLRQNAQGEIAALPTATAAPTATFFADVEVLATGTAGPYAFDVVTSEDPNALVFWLRTNAYQVTPAMEPLIKVYTDEGMIFLAMKLQPDQDVQNIQPIKMTYRAALPSIPIRLTAVAANPNMTVQTWIFAKSQAVPQNYAHPAVDEADLRNDPFSTDGTSYMTVVDQTIDLYQGRAFITQFAQPTSSLLEMQPEDPLLRELAENYPYLTRILGRISPEEMTVDPVLELAESRADVSNLIDLSDQNADIFWGCESAPVQLEFDPSVVPDNFQ